MIDFDGGFPVAKHLEGNGYGFQNLETLSIVNVVRIPFKLQVITNPRLVPRLVAPDRFPTARLRVDNELHDHFGTMICDGGRTLNLHAVPCPPEMLKHWRNAPSFKR